MDYGKLALEAIEIGLNPTGYLLSQTAESTSKKVTHSDAAADKELATLRAEAERQELQMRISEAQARVAQEIAIARRIESAEEVEMEEFYDFLERQVLEEGLMRRAYLLALADREGV